MSNVVPFPRRPAAAGDAPAEGPDPVLGARLDRLVDRLEAAPEDPAALRRLVTLLAPGISVFHEAHAALHAIFDRVRAAAPLDAHERALLLRTARTEAAFLRTGAV